MSADQVKSRLERVDLSVRNAPVFVEVEEFLQVL